MLLEFNDLARREEVILANGPSRVDLDSYLNSIERVQNAITLLNASNLGFCRLTLGKLKTAYTIGIETLTSKFKELLIEASKYEISSANLYESTINETVDLELYRELLKISTFAASFTNQQVIGDIIGYYCEVRSNFMMQNLQTKIKNVEVVKGSYAKGSHPFISALRDYFMMMKMEVIFAGKVIPAAFAHDAVRKTIKHPSDLIKMTGEALVSKVTKSVLQNEFVEQIWVFDVIEAFNDLFFKEDGPENAKELIKSTLKALTLSGVDFLRELMENIQNSNRSASMIIASSNATVHEQTSTLLNCLKRMLDYERIVEALLNRWSQREWDGFVGLIEHDTQIFAMALYYQDLLKGLEIAIDKYADNYRKRITSILFQLNNYNFILKTFKSSTMGLMLTMETEQKYESIVESLTNEYLSIWRNLPSVLEEGSMSKTGPLKPKEKLKIFTHELEEIVRIQETCSVPDTEIRSFLIRNIRDAVISPFIRNQDLFIGTHVKSRLDPETVEQMLSRLYQA